MFLRMIFTSNLIFAVPLVLPVTSMFQDQPPSRLTSDGDQESQFQLLLFNYHYQNVLVLPSHQDTVSHTLLVTRPSPQVPMVLLETSSKLDHPALLPTSDGDQVSQFHLFLFNYKVYKNEQVM